MEVADVVGILSKQLNQTYADQDTTQHAQDLQEVFIYAYTIVPQPHY